MTIKHNKFASDVLTITKSELLRMLQGEEPEVPPYSALIVKIVDDEKEKEEKG